MWNRVRGFLGKAHGGFIGFIVAFGLAFSGVASAADSVTIPTMPVDFADLASQGAVILGTVVSGCIGIVVVVALINMGISWLRRAFAGR